MITTQARAAKASPPVSPKPAETSIVERMADHMRDMRAGGQTVTAETLAVFGDYTSAEVSKHAPEAANLARSLANRTLA